MDTVVISLGDDKSPVGPKGNVDTTNVMPVKLGRATVAITHPIALV